MLETRNDIGLFLQGSMMMGWNGQASKPSGSPQRRTPKALWRRLLLGNLARDETLPEGENRSNLGIHGSCGFHGPPNLSTNMCKFLESWGYPQFSSISNDGILPYNKPTSSWGHPMTSWKPPCRSADQPQWRELLRVLGPRPAGPRHATAGCGPSSGADLLGRCAARAD